MEHIFTIYSVFFLVTSMLSFFVAILAWQRRTVKGAKELSLLMVIAGFWALINVGESGAQTQTDKIFWSQIEYFAAASSPIIYLIFTLEFTTNFHLFSIKRVVLLFIIPVITIILAWTNSWHHLIWTGFSPISPHSNLLEYYHGLWFWIGYLGYNYLVFIVATIFILRFIFKHKSTFRFQGWIIFVAGLCPWLASILYVTNSNPVAGLNLAPASISLSGLLFLIAIIYIRFLDLIPVAREILVETLQDGILALDHQDRIQDINSAAILFLHIKTQNLLGINFYSIKLGNEKLAAAVSGAATYDQHEISYLGEHKTYKIIKQTIKDHLGSRLIIIRDISDQIAQQKELIRQDILLLAVSQASQLLFSEKELEKAIPKALETIGLATGQDRAYLFENHIDPKTNKLLLSQRFEWVNEGISPQINNPELQNICYDEVLPRWYKILSSGDLVLGRVADFPIEEQEILNEQDIISLLVVPIEVDNVFWGFVGFDNCSISYDWRPAERAILSTLAATLGSATALHRSFLELNHQSKLRHMLTEISSEYINLPLHLVDEAINKSLANMSKFVTADRSYIFDFNQDTNFCSNVYEWCQAGIKPRLTRLQNIVLGVDFVEAFSQGKTIYVPDVDSLAEGNTKEVLQPLGVKTLLAFPMIHNGVCIGFLGFDFINSFHSHSETEQQLLHVYSQMLVNIKLRKINEEKLLQMIDKAKESSRLKTAFINNISHEIRTPLNGILSFGEFLTDMDLSEAEKVGYLKMLENSSQRLLQTINDYTDIAMITSGTLVAQKRKFYLSQLVDEINEIIASKHQEKPIYFEIAFPKDCNKMEVTTDKNLISKVFNILIDNAIKFTLNGKITVGCMVTQDNFNFYVQDTGKGIEPKKQADIFDCFTQEDYSTTRNYEGSGLGLSIAKGIVDLLGGKIWVQSDLGNGSTFYFKIGSF